MSLEPTEAVRQAIALSDWLESSVTHIRKIARSCRLGGDASWDGVLEQLCVARLSEDERKGHLVDGPLGSRARDPQAKGALLIEVRWAFESVERRTRADLRPIDRAIDISEDRYVRALENRLAGLVDDELREHLAAIAPKPTTSSIFANALASTPNYGAMGVRSGTSVQGCRTCGGPRMRAEAPTCSFCGSAYER